MKSIMAALKITIVIIQLTGLIQSPEFLKNALKFAQQFSRPGECLENRDKVMKH